MSFTKRWFVRIILLSSVILMLLVLKGYFFEWDEGIEELKKVYPAKSFVEVGGKTRWSISGNSKSHDYLLIPGFQIVRVSKMEDSRVIIRVQNEFGLVTISVGLLALCSLLIFIVIPHVRKYGV